MNLSDIAAMAGVPRAAVVAVALPRADAAAVAQGLYTGMRELAERFGVDLVGGDTNAWDGPLVISVTVLGEATARARSAATGARPGDAILVTGPLGGSLFAGRHLRPEPRIAEALALHQVAAIHALIDISDGLSSDLGHILAESGGLGAVLDAAAIPIHADAHEMSRRDGRPRSTMRSTTAKTSSCAWSSRPMTPRGCSPLRPAPAMLYSRRHRDRRRPVCGCAVSMARNGRSSPWASIISAPSKIRHGRETNRQHADSRTLIRKTRPRGWAAPSPNWSSRASSSGWSARSGPARPGWRAPSPKRWASIRRRSRARRSS